MPDVNAVNNIKNVNAAIETNNTIANVLSHINNQPYGIFLPYIQRDFVWDEEHICELLDSLMRGYPMGTILVWETNKPVNYRFFVENYNPDEINYDFSIGDDGQTRKYVLDGQQRLQSLYLAMHGTYDGKVLFFYLFSDAESGYRFEFCPFDTPESDGWINVPKFLAQNTWSESAIIREFERNSIIPQIRAEDFDDLIRENTRRLYDIFNTDHNIPVQILRQNIPLKDIAEIFVRTNSGGIVLDATDLAMATITSEWAEAGEAFQDLIPTIQRMGFSNPRSFILQTCFAILLGTTVIKPDDFGKPHIQNKLQNNFKEISESIKDVLNFINNIMNESALGTFQIPLHNPILVLITYRYTRGKEHWDNKKDAARAFLFTALLSRDFRKPTQKLMRELLKYVSNKQNDFSIKSISGIFKNNNRNFAINPNDLLDTRLNTPLANLVLYLVYSGQPGFNAETMKIHDHIFPKSELMKVRQGRTQCYSKDKYDSVINCELLTEDDNRAKAAIPPAEYLNSLGSQKESFLKLHAIPQQYHDGVDLWDLENYETFLEQRKELLSKRISYSLKGLVSLKANPIGTILKHLFVRSNKNLKILKKINALKIKSQGAFEI